MTDASGTPIIPGRRGSPLRRRHDLSPGGFKTVWLNLAGWSALAGAGLVAGVVLTLLSPMPVAAALPVGVVVTWAGFLVADRVRWRDMETGMGFGSMDDDTAAAIVAELGRRGISARYEKHEFPSDDGSVHVQRSIVCRNADAETAREVALAMLRGRG